MAETSQERALKNYRKRLTQRGIARFEVLGLDADRDLIRSLAKRLAQGDAEANELRAAVSRSMETREPGKGGILAALLRSPLSGSGIKITRSKARGRKVDL